MSVISLRPEVAEKFQLVDWVQHPVLTITSVGEVNFETIGLVEVESLVAAKKLHNFFLPKTPAKVVPPPIIEK